jgi:hypothetical protein
MTDITTVASNATSHGTTYNVSATYYSTSIQSQQLISSHPTYTDKSASTPMRLARSIRALGTLNVVKKDEWNRGVKGATFKISLGSNVFSSNTNEEGIATFKDIPAGTYTVEETYDMLIEKANEKTCGGLTKYEYATWIVGKFTVSYTIGIFVASILIAIITNNKGGIKFVINTR